LPWLKAKLGPDALVAAAAIGTTIALGLFGVARGPWSALAASFLAGVCWIAAVSNLNVSAQFALPEPPIAVIQPAESGDVEIGFEVRQPDALINGAPARREQRAGKPGVGRRLGKLGILRSCRLRNEGAQEKQAEQKEWGDATDPSNNG
jgi:hypothetical protein